MEYASFHYLMHKVPDPVKPVYTTGPEPLTFAELYSPRDRRQIGKLEKSFWRTRDRIEFCIWEDRALSLVLITCRNIDSNEVYRTIFLNAEKLYFELEAKARGDRERIVKKKDKKLADDAGLGKSVTDYLNARLNIKAEPLPWPEFTLPISSSEPVSATTTAVETVVNNGEGAAVHTERMCTFDRLSGDECEPLEIVCPQNYSDAGIPNAKFRSSADAAIAASVANTTSEPTATSTTSATISAAETPTASSAAVASSTSSVTSSASTTKKSAAGAGAATATATADSTSAQPSKAVKKPTNASPTKTNTKKVAPIG